MQIKLFTEKKRSEKYYGSFLSSASEMSWFCSWNLREKQLHNCDSSVDLSLYITDSLGGDFSVCVLLYPAATLKQWFPAS